MHEKYVDVDERLKNVIKLDLGQWVSIKYVNLTKFKRMLAPWFISEVNHSAGAMRNYNSIDLW